MNVEEIMKILPHRYPFLLVDGLLELNEEKIKAFKNVSINEPFFQGHFPNYPIMPGVLIVEGMAQTAGLLLLKDTDENVIPLFTGIDKARFKKEVRPGDKLIYDLEILQKKANMFKLKGIATVEGQICAQAEIMVGIKKS
ncbi:MULTISPECIES: 3-hydroxyacyl-ACP dehydratase FabZ [Petrotoga]|uniref:3-hydroxyacyl-[acyl-carrier-protein] dehydratase FabZ n=2 Tax=Petrotoga sibirica TaxID=156202 RepID=A0A4R8EXQ4_9BACT|nr:MULTISPECIES: 3-hydroxyacyl-ACP dehydratase FabZ [Petrotoga]POZ88864.1 hydroxymyristoyl-ACP dehydratase [Petrotoga sibirica DSM 13575]POZ90982.1 hydroxymyristoyl-ACP dehydratase [Petrotoga sp. SL27]TDX17492.1 3-hydroxyacyl-[acyl-carrier-protein] dehydratase [Petrotoga sibirica]